LFFFTARGLNFCRRRPGSGRRLFHDEAVQKRYSEALMDRGFARLPAIDLRYIL